MQEAYCRVIDLIDAGTINHRAVSMTLEKAVTEPIQPGKAFENRS